jgi:hypothetical protein
MTRAQMEKNPLFAEDGIRGKENVFKSRRLDRINQTTKMQGKAALPFGYMQVKENLLPFGIPESALRTETRLVEEGYTFHRGKDPATSRDIVQFADDPNSIRHYGENQYAIKSDKLPAIPEYVEKFAREYFGEDVSDILNPRDIVDSAGVWDDRQFVSDLWQEFGDRFEREGVLGFKTNDGAVLFPGAGEEHGIVIVEEDS